MQIIREVFEPQSPDGPSWAAANVRSYQPGVAVVDPWVSGGPANTKYYHTDHLGTTRTMSVAAGFDGGTRVYTAFGEVVAGPTDRFGYVGAHGYQTHDDLPFLHVGARYYDPGSGRFLQRDPVGIEGGINSYAYAGSMPTIAVDPDGELIQLIVIIAIAVLVLDEGAQWANAPAPGDSTMQGGPGGGGASVIAGGIAAGGAAAKGAGYAIHAGRYPNAGGGGITVARHGRRIFGIDCHRLPDKAKFGKHRGKIRPHVHPIRRPKEHWPWEL